MAASHLRLISWNVNGLRACARKGYLDWLGRCRAHIVGLQEVRALPEQLEPQLRKPRRWHTAFSPAEKKGYSGVAFYSRTAPDWVRTSLDEERFDREGRLIIAGFGRLVVANGYFPKGSGTLRDNSRVPYKLDFYARLFDTLDRYRRGGYRVVVMGDFNTAHREIDLANPKSNVKNSGFLPEERAELDRWLLSGWTDTFRRYCTEPGQYSWWSQRLGARERNVGWRIDYLLASQAATRHLRDGFISSGVRGSDHCPVGADFDRTIVGS
jgi:exodeoxyribonuclease-3